MRNAFQPSLLAAAALVLGAACGDPSERAAIMASPSSAANSSVLPSSAAAPSPNGKEDTPDDPPGGASNPPSSELPSVVPGTPLAPVIEATPSQMPAATQPPDAQPPPAAEAPVSGPDPKFFIFLLIGQSNMEGQPASEAQDRVINARVKVLALRDCPQRDQVHNQWYAASPSLHTCGNTLGPGDYFAKTLADALPDHTIGLVPDAIAGVDIDIFRKGVVSARRAEFSLPPDNQRNSAYETVIERARLAREVGVIRGILFHQGESDAATGALQQAWPGKVQGLVRDIRTDLGLDAADVPFLAGELLANGPPQNGCCGNAMNPLVRSLPALIPNSFVVSGSGLGVNSDGLHYNVAGQREFGQRYGQTMLEALGL